MPGTISATELRRIASTPAPGTGGSGGTGTVDMLSVVADMLPLVVGLFTSLFGDKYQYSTGVRWLTAYYQYYVLGQGNVTGTHTSSGLDEKYTPEAQTWFTAVLGVPIFDRYRLHALMGTDPAAGRPLNNSDAARVDAYLRSDWLDTQGVPREKVERAVQIAKKFRWGTLPGSWKQYGIPADPPEVAAGANGGGGLLPPVKDNLVLYGGAALLLLGLIFYYDSDT